uniref:Tim44 domain-containing protein n=1 Tax=Meloidogyne hapla TaxID=6305 RepID=A0A1I8BM84_MELHA
MLSYNFATISRLSRTFCRSYQRFPNKFIDTLKQELAKNKELQENKRQLEERLKKLSDSSVKEKYIKIQKESSASTELIKHQLNEFSDYVNKLAVSIKDSQIGQDAFKQLKAAAEVAEQVAKQVGDTQVYRQVANTASEIDKLADVRMYSKPEELRMRSDSFTSSFAQRHVEVNTDATQVELHKESRWYSGWKAFSESNPYYSKLLDWKMRIDESESIVFRGVRSTLERIQFAFTPQDDVSKVLTEISKVDPNFNKHDWLRFCEKEMIPNILEAVIQMNVNVLNDWCYERAS